MTRPDQSLSSLTPGGGKRRDPGNEVVSTDDQPLLKKKPEDTGFCASIVERERENLPMIVKSS